MNTDLCQPRHEGCGGGRGGRGAPGVHGGGAGAVRGAAGGDLQPLPAPRPGAEGGAQGDVDQVNTGEAGHRCHNRTLTR